MPLCTYLVIAGPSTSGKSAAANFMLDSIVKIEEYTREAILWQGGSFNGLMHTLSANVRHRAMIASDEAYAQFEQLRRMETKDRAPVTSILNSLWSGKN
jgi:hypothetical protein